jgi:hypothetical protein
MAESEIQSPALIGAALIAGLGLFASQSSFGWLSTAGGLTLLLILFAYDRHGSRSGLQSVAFSAVCGLAFVLGSGIGLQRLIDRAGLEIWLLVAWAGATVIFTAIDRTRVSARTFPAPAVPVSPAVAPTPSTPKAAHPSKTHGLGLSGPGFEFTPAAAPVANTAVPTPSAPMSVAEPEPAPATAYAREETSVLEPVTQAPIPTAAAPPPTPAYTPEEATIYVDVIGQGISFLRSVRAQHVARDIYRIVDEMPADETWRYEPGQTVRCRKKKLSSGKALVAFEEIILQRAN